MERTPAACAMEWSIKLDKGLRSKKPGKSIEAIQQIGQRLEWWNREPKLTIAEYNMFGLVPGEDKLFANKILLRLADAFCSGDKHTKNCVVKVFLSELRRQRRRTSSSRQKNGGIFSKHMLENHLELLRRVKVVFDSGDVEERALALVLFGCWANFAKDSADIRYLVLSSLVSSHVLQVKASLFAGGCFCELADDFASVLLEVLVNMMTSPDTLMAVKIAGVQAFAKMGCSSSLANRAYKTGLKLLLDSLEEDFSVAMLISLSKIASKSILLISGQVDLLFSFLTCNKTLRLQGASLRCLYFILARGVCQLAPSTDAMKTWLNILNESKFPPFLQIEALEILHQILLYSLHAIPCMDMLEYFSKLLMVADNVMQSTVMSQRLLAIQIVVDLSGKLVRRMQMISDGLGSSPLASQVVSFIIDRISLLLKPVVDLHQRDSEIAQEVKSLLNGLLLLVEECPDLGGLVLDKIYQLLKYLMKTFDRVSTGAADLSSHEIVEFGERNKFILSKLMLYASRVVVSCLQNSNEAGALTTQFLNMVKLLVEDVHQCNLFDCYTHTIYSILFHSWITYYYLLNDTEVNKDIDRNLCISHYDYSVQQEIFTLEHAKKMLARNDNWSAYKAGKYAACQGAWFTAAFIFEQLMTRVQSDSSYCWLKSLAQFGHCERKIQLLLLPKQGFDLLNWLGINKLSVSPLGYDLCEIRGGTTWKINLTKDVENLVGVCNILHSSAETVGALVTSGHAFGFQRWFLALRSKVLETVVDMLKLLATVPLAQDNISSSGKVKGSVMVENPRFSEQVTSLAYPLIQISFRLRRLAQEFDLIATSFIGMGQKSLNIILTLALSCSILAFSSGFALFTPSIHALENLKRCSFENSKDYLHAILIQDLVGRLWHTESDTRTKLCLLLNVCGQHKSCLSLLSRNQILNIGYEAKGILSVCRYAVTRIVDLQNEAKTVHDDESISQVSKDGLQLLQDITIKWMHIPFKAPNHFFQVRPCVSSELFAMDGDTRSLDGLFVLPGHFLSLNLCLQLKNMPPDLPVQSTKLYCILSCRTSFQIPCHGENKTQTQLSCQDWGTDDMVYLNGKLLQYVAGTKTKSMPSRDIGGDYVVVETCVCFEPNERWQGFSTCLLDVSAFPVGSYRIKWHSCCLDNKNSCWSILPLNGLVFTVQKSAKVSSMAV